MTYKKQQISKIRKNLLLFEILFFLFGIMLRFRIHPVDYMLDHHLFYINIKAEKTDERK